MCEGYLRSTMTQHRLNHLIILHIHKELTDNIDSSLLLDQNIGSQFLENSKAVTLNQAQDTVELVVNYCNVRLVKVECMYTVCTCSSAAAKVYM